MKQRFNLAIHFITYTMQVQVQKMLNPANNYVSQTAAQGWLKSTSQAPLRFRSTGMMLPTHGGDLITPQTILRGVLPTEAMAVATGRAIRTNIK